MSGTRISTLIGRELDRRVDEAERMAPVSRSAWDWLTVPPAYSTDPRLGQPLIERLGISSGRVGNLGWWAVVPGCELGSTGPTQLIAGCRAFLVSLYGESLPS